MNCADHTHTSAFQKIPPPLSNTETEAIEAGTVGWDGELFSGNLDWQKHFSTPITHLTTAELEFLDGPVDELCRMLDDWRIVEHDWDLPAPVWQFLKENRFFDLIIPPEYGGLGFSALAHSQVIMKIASRSYTAAVTVWTQTSRPSLLRSCRLHHHNRCPGALAGPDQRPSAGCSRRPLPTPAPDHFPP